MATKNLQTLAIEIVAETSRLQSDIARAQGIVSRGFDTMRRSAATFTRVLAGIGGAGLGLGAIAAGIKDTVDRMGELADQADKVGVSVEGFQRLQYAAEQSGVATETLSTSLARLSVNIGKAADGSKQQAEALAKLGLEAEKLKDVGLEEAFLQILDALNKLPDGISRNTTAAALLGRGFAELGPLIAQGGDAARELGEELNQLGIVSDESARKAEAFGDDMDKVKRSIDGLKFSIVEGGLLDSISRIGKAMAEAAREAGPLQAALVGVGGVFEEVFIGDFAEPIVKAKREINELDEEIQKLQNAIDSGLDLRLFGGGAQSQIDALKAQRGVIREQLSAMEQQADAERKLAAEQRKIQEEKRRQFEDEGDKRVEEVKASTSASNAQASAAKKAAAEAERLRESQQQAIIGMERQLLGTKELTEVERTLFEIRRGSFAEFDDATQQQLLGLSEQIDKQKELAKAEKERAEQAEELARIQKETQEALRTEANAVIEATRTPDERFAAESVRLAEMFDQGRISAETFGRALDQLEEQTDNTKSAMEQLGATFTSAFEDAIVEGKSISEIFQGLEKDIVRIITRTLVLEPLFANLTKALSGGGGGGGLGGIFDFLFGGARAMGGPVTAGHAYLVGEQGPEMFVPSSSGAIVPGGMGGITVVVNGVRDSADLRASAQQVAAAAGGAAQRALARNT